MNIDNMLEKNNTAKSWIEAINYEQKTTLKNARMDAINIKIKNIISTLKGVNIRVTILTKALLPRFVRVGEYVSIANEKEDERIMEGEITSVNGKECVICSEKKIAETLINKIGEKMWLLPFSSIPYSLMRENVANILTRANIKLAEEILTKDQIKNNNLVLIQGPPGTGKTTTIAKECEKIYEENKNADRDKNKKKKIYRVLLSAYTHKANANIAEMLDEHSIPFVCIDVKGLPKRLQKYQLENMVKRAIIQATLQNPTVDWQRYKNLIRKQILNQNNFIISTAMAAPKRFKVNDSNPPFDLAIIDEGSQIPLPIVAGLCALAKKIKVFGDPCQLPPVVVAPLITETIIKTGREDEKKIKQPKINLLKKTLFDIVQKQRVILLDKQYRGRPEIFSLISALFYRGEVKTGRYIEKHFEPVIEFIDTSLITQEENDRINNTEGTICQELLKAFAENTKGINKKRNLSIGVISPFRNQANYLSSVLHPEDETIKLEVGTVHVARGRTYDIVIFSTAATNPSPFLNPDRETIISLHSMLAEIFTTLRYNNPEQLGYKIGYYNKIKRVYKLWSKTLQEYKEELTLKTEPIKIKMFEDKPELELELDLKHSALPENTFAKNLFNVALSRARYKLIIISNYEGLYKNIIIRLIYEWIKIFGEIKRPREESEIRSKKREKT